MSQVAVHKCTTNLCAHASNAPHFVLGVMQWHTTNDAAPWHTVAQFECRNAPERVSNATGMPLTGDMQLILTSETFRFCSEAADTWWLFSVSLLYSLFVHWPSVSAVFNSLRFNLYGSFWFRNAITPRWFLHAVWGSQWATTIDDYPPSTLN